MDKQRNTAARLGFMLPVVLFVLFFVVCCGVMACVFLRSAAVSERAGAYNDGVQLCRNQAEICREAGMEPGVYCYDENLQPAESGIYRVTVEAENAETPAGILQTGRITACIGETEFLYSLELTVYCPEVRHGE